LAAFYEALEHRDSEMCDCEFEFRFDSHRDVEEPIVFGMDDARWRTSSQAVAGRYRA